MGTIIPSISNLSWKNCQQLHPSQNVIAQEKAQSRTRAASENGSPVVQDVEFRVLINRRAAVASGVALVSSAAFGFPGDGLAVVKQGLLAGRIPGLSEPDEQG